MALKPHRVESYTDVSNFINTVSERGGIVVHTSSGSGVAMDDALAVVSYPTGTPSGTKPAGLLLNDVVSYDLTRQHLNWYRDEIPVGGKATVLRQGQVLTNFLASGQAPTAGADAYYDGSGYLTTVSTNSVKVGRFLGVKDADGYIKVDINIT
jgi:hypothetical protein